MKLLIALVLPLALFGSAIAFASTPAKTASHLHRLGAIAIFHVANVR
jgi:hypothetical protein